MNASQIHLSFTHLPVILSFVGLAIMVVSTFLKNTVLAKTSMWILLVAGLAAIPVFFTGEGAEEVVEDMQDVSKSIIGKHENIAKLGMVVLEVTAILALLGLLFYKKDNFRKIMVPILLVFTFGTTAIMTRIAQLGGEIRHSETRPGFVVKEKKELTNAEDRSVQTIYHNKHQNE